MTGGQLVGREKWERDVACRFALLSEQGIYQCADALQAMTWAEPGNDELEHAYLEAKALIGRIERLRENYGGE